MPTPAERAAAVFDALEAEEGDQICGTHFRPEREGWIADAIRAAVLEEREECARLAEAHARPVVIAGMEVLIPRAAAANALDIAGAVRARPAP